MKYLFAVTAFRNKGGAERIVTDLANLLVSQGHEVAVLCEDNKVRSPAYSLDAAVEIIRFTSANTEESLRETFVKCKLYNPDLFFFWYFDSTLLFFTALGKLLNVPMGAQECSNPTRVIKNISKGLNISIEEAISLRLGLINLLSGLRLLIDDYKKMFPKIFWDKIHVFKNAFNLTCQENVEKKNYILSVNGATNKINKNGFAVLKAFIILAKKYPDINLVFVGTPSLKEVFLPVIESHDLLERVVFLGVVNDMNNVYQQAKVHVITSYEEGLPNSVCEAMLCGVPSIGFNDCDGTKHIIEDNITGVLVERDLEYKNLALAIEKIFLDDEYYNKLSSNCIIEAKKLFSKQANIANWMNLLSVCINYKNRIIPNFTYNIKFAINRLFKKAILPYDYSPSIDFIIPLYNKENYIISTVESILSSTYQNLRVIIVDDCSTDSSYTKVINKYHDNPKVVIYKRSENGGLSCARNSGLDLATADYIQFWDADDIFYADKIDYLMHVALFTYSDIITTLAKRNNEVIERYLPSSVNFYSIKQPYCYLALKTASNCFKLYRRKFLEDNQLWLVPFLYMQDTEFNLRAFNKAKSVTMLNVCAGEYCYYGDSNSKVVNEDRYRSAVKIIEYYLTNKNEYKNIPDDYAQAFILKFVVVYFVQKLVNHNTHTFEDNYYEIILNSILKMKKGVRFLLESSSFHDVKYGVKLAIFSKLPLANCYNLFGNLFVNLKAYPEDKLNNLLEVISNEYNYPLNLLKLKVKTICRIK